MSTQAPPRPRATENSDPGLPPTHSLYGKEDAHPVASLLESLTGGISSVPHHFCNSSRSIVPHIEHRYPREELHESDLPERGGRILQQRDPVGRFFLLFRYGIVLRIVLRIPLLNLRGGVDHAEDQDSGTYIERPDDRVGNHALICHIADTKEGEEEGEHITHHRSRIAQERLDGIGLSLLCLVDHIAHEHLKRLHRHVDAGVEEHEGYQTEDHGGTHGQSQRSRVGQQAHHEHSHCGTYK